MLFLVILISIQVMLLSLVFFSLWYDHSVLAIEPQSIYFGEEINVSKDNGTSELPQVTAEGNNVYVVWQDNTSGNYDIYFAHSSDNGKNFESARNLSKNNGSSELPQVTADGNNVYVVWQDNTSGNYDVYFKSSSTNGTKFKSIRNLSKNNGSSELPQIESYNNLFYVTWKDSANSTDRIFFKEGLKGNSTNGAEFGSLMKVTNTGNSSKPELFVGADFSPSVWASNLANASFIEFYPINFFDDSKNPIQLTKLSPKDSILSVRISGHNSYAYCVWENKKIANGDIFFKRISTNLD
jgi:glutaredoxin